MPVVSAGRGAASVAYGPCWTARLLYLPAVPPGPDHPADGQFRVMVSQAARSDTRRTLVRHPVVPSRGRRTTMPDIDRTADLKVTADQGPVPVEIPLAGRASEHWRDIFRKLASKRTPELHAKAEEQEDRTWVIVLLPSRPDFHPEPMLDAVTALISEV